MIAHAFSRSLSLARRWSCEGIHPQVRRWRRPKLRGLLFYTLLVFIFFILVSSNLQRSSTDPDSLGGLDEQQQSGSNLKKDLNDRSNKLKSIQNKERNIKNIRKSKEDIKLSVEDGRRNRRSAHLSSNSIINPHNYHLMISNAMLCKDLRKINLLILVASSADHFSQRQAIRDTWGEAKYLTSYGVKLGFLLANPNYPEIQKKIVEEFRTYGDTIQEDFVESYMNLTLKSTMGIKWAQNYCPKASFVMKTDDDIFVNIPLLMENLIELQGKRVFVGCIKQRKSFLPVNLSPGAQVPTGHPLFVAGAGYVFSGSLAKELYEASLRTRIIPVEDVYVSGHLAAQIGAHPPVHDSKFSCGEMVLNDCDMNEAYTGHKITPERMREIWDKLNPNSYDSPCKGRD